jgi:hypothetical protein
MDHQRRRLIEAAERRYTYPKNSAGDPEVYEGCLADLFDRIRAWRADMELRDPNVPRIDPLTHLAGLLSLLRFLSRQS